MRSRLRPALGLLLVLASAACAAQAGADETPRTTTTTQPATAPLQAQVDALLTRLIASGQPGYAVLVARGDQVLVRSARGMASVELGVPLSPQNVFRIGSVTKQMAAAALLKLVEQGRASLDDPLAKYLPDYPNAGAITLLQLLNHTSGVKSYTSVPDYIAEPIRRTLSTAQLVDMFKSLPVDFQPGASWAYNNSGYVLVGAVLERITRQPWHVAVTQLVLQPAGLAQTVYGENIRVVPQMAEGYSLAGGMLRRAGYADMSQPHAAGALLSTVDDLLRWNRALHGGRLLQPESYRRMTTPEGAAVPRRYGLGIMQGSVRGEPAFTHGGGIHGFLSSLVYLPGPQLTVVALGNADSSPVSPEVLVQRVAALALGRPFVDGPTVPVDATLLQTLAGVYRKEGGSEAEQRTLRVEGGTLVSQRAGGPPFRLRAIGPQRWVFDQALSHIDTQADGQALRFYPDGDGAGERWRRIGDVPAEPPALALDDAQRQALLGDYRSPQLTLKVFIDAGGVLRVQVPGQPAFALEARTPRQLQVKAVGARFEFAPGEGPAQSVLLLQGGARITLQRAP